uniref:FBA_2 domain-containing protein n=1 Tax=Caenorhabditis tropicalis TaxID=1561998 RepID=A0A1I7U6G2_9PELO
MIRIKCRTVLIVRMYTATHNCECGPKTDGRGRIAISLCSSKTNSIVKSVRREKRKISLDVRNNQFVTVFVDGSTEKLLVGQVPEPAADWPMCKRVTINGQTTRIAFSKEQCVTVWADVEMGTMEMIKYLDALLGAKVKVMEITDDSGGRIMKWLQRRQGQLSKVVVFNQKDTIFEVEALQNIIRDCEAKHICLDVDTRERPFQIQNSNGKCKLFQCRDDTVVSVESLMQIEAPEIYINARRFTSAEINQFIKHWMNGGNAHLKALCIRHSISDEHDMISGISVRWTPGNKDFESVTTQWSVTLNGGFEVQRNDGTIAFFNNSQNFFCFALEKVLHY